MLRMSVAAEEYVMIGDDIRLVFLGGHGKSYAHHDRCAQGVEHRQEQGAGEKDTGFGTAGEDALLLPGGRTSGEV